MDKFAVSMTVDHKYQKYVRKDDGQRKDDNC